MKVINPRNQDFWIQRRGSKALGLRAPVPHKVTLHSMEVSSLAAFVVRVLKMVVKCDC